MATPQYSHPLNLFGVLSESKRIINAHSRHFLALSVFFLLPLSFSLIVYPTLKATLLQPDFFGHFLPPHQSLFLSLSDSFPESTKALILFTLIYSSVFFLFCLLAVATITYSTFHGFYGRPVKLVSSIKSVLYIFIPLLYTLVLSRVIMFMIVAVFVLFVALIFKSLLLLGLEVSLDSKYFMGFMIFVGIIVVLILIVLHVNWILASVIVVAESKWGFEPLRRSASLVKGMRGVAFSMILLYSFAIWFLIWASSESVANATEATGWWTLAFVVQTVVGSAFVTLLMLHYLAANVVLYMYCKALQGELAFEIAEEFAYHYVSLPFDYQKVPHIVSVVQD